MVSYLPFWKWIYSPLEWAYFNYCTNYEMCTVLGGWSRNWCFILNSKINGTSETHWPKWDDISLTQKFNVTIQQLLEWKTIHLCPASLNLGTCASIVFDAENPKSNSGTIGTRVLITGIITAQNITQLYTMIPRVILDLLFVYIILICLKLNVENFINQI